MQLNTIEDLMNEVLLDTKLKTRLYDGFIVPATIAGGLFEEEGRTCSLDFTSLTSNHC